MSILIWRVTTSAAALFWAGASAGGATTFGSAICSSGSAAASWATIGEAVCRRVRERVLNAGGPFNGSFNGVARVEN